MKKKITVPHSGEQVELNENYSSWGSRGGAESYVSLSPARNITYYFANGPGGHTNTIYYSDWEIEYTYDYGYEQIYRCVRGNCASLIDKIPFGTAYTGNSCPDSVVLISCFSNGNYSKISAKLPDATKLFQSKSMDQNDFMQAQVEYDEKNDEKVSISLSQDEMVELNHWRSVCKYPYEVHTEGPSFDPFNHDKTDASNHLVVSKMHANFTKEEGVGCPGR